LSKPLLISANNPEACEANYLFGVVDEAVRLCFTDSVSIENVENLLVATLEEIHFTPAPKLLNKSPLNSLLMILPS
jgi:hypothetical protein